ncbi:MAG: hypothetical protein HOL98_15985 [Gammaproteobacteria bacterium]|nr:hypothetical protein [Gammaproteobacteria bacterium]MBT5204960.1 hypothetical protein [Gammaproteobacteria bacterium]MBT5601923.1 hypothetical protein [Gammaproteobacteria bacterium]MBT6247181.1 hypothetical protein [Gammaproteobacteria bacterium]
MSLILGFSTMQATAHRQHHMWTTIVQADTQDALEISHRIHAQDAIKILRNMGVNEPELTSLQELAQLALYLESTFIITSPDGTPTQPKLIGSELEGNYVFVYQELTSGHHPGEYSYQSSGLMEVHSDQVNYIQIHHHNRVETLEFQATLTPAVS